MKRYKPKESQWNKIPFNKRTDIINNLFKPIKNEKKYTENRADSKADEVNDFGLTRIDGINEDLFI